MLLMSYLMEKISTILKHPALIRKILMGQAVPFLLPSGDPGAQAVVNVNNSFLGYMVCSF